jgi:hypothetical protein
LNGIVVVATVVDIVVAEDAFLECLFFWSKQEMMMIRQRLQKTASSLVVSLATDA